jgi:hypothetical protein
MKLAIGEHRPPWPLPPPPPPPPPPLNLALNLNLNLVLNLVLVLNLPHHPLPTYQTPVPLYRMPPQEATIDANRAWVRLQNDLFFSRSGLQEHPLAGSECRAVDRDPVLF